ncbi:MAG: hypothetical protein LUC97_04225 [Clostridiales bacterium]|nr:hypothetical protein [Clostridiales bacterium]
MEQTSNFKLNKPEYTDVADISDLNENTDIIDANLGKVTQPSYTDKNSVKYADINGMHLRTDNSIYAEGGIKVVNCDPCKDGTNLTESMVTSDGNKYVLAKIDESGNGSFRNVSADSIDADSIEGDTLTIEGITAQNDGIHFRKAKGAVFTDNSSKNASDGSRKFLIGAYYSTPETDSNYMPSSNPNAGIIARVESDENGNGTYLDLYADQVVCRTEDSVFQTGTVKADTVRGDVIRAGTTLKIGGDSVADLLNKKSDDSHTHALDGDTITGTLPITKGGTGGTTAAAARSNLGLSSAATKAYTTSVASGNASLPTSAAVYTAISNAVSSIDVSSRTHIVVASYDTKNPLKANADYTCTSSDATSVLKTAIDAIAAGGKIELLDGTYYLQYSDDVIELNKNMTIEGCGHKTVIHQPASTSAGEAKYIFNITSTGVTIKNMMICDEDVSSPVSMIYQQAQGTIYEGVFFIFNGSETTSYNCCITGSGDCNYTRIQNCRAYKGFNNSEKIMFDFSGCTGFGGVIGGNISSGYNNISVSFASESQKNNTAVYGHTNIDLEV